MINPTTQGVTIIVDELGTEYHSINDWGLAIGNNDYIGTPVLEEHYIEVPGANKLLDVSQALTGRRTYKSRPINIKFGAVNKAVNWDLVISTFRNRIDGRVVRLIFDNDETHYWSGRCQITDFDRIRTLGEFTLSLPYADAFKYDIKSNIDPWLWDPFDFENDVVPEEPVIDISGTKTIIVPSGNMYTVPTFTVNNMTSPITMSVNNRVYPLVSGYNYFPTLMVNGDTETTITFNGEGQVIMEYRGGSL